MHFRAILELGKKAGKMMLINAARKIDKNIFLKIILYCLIGLVILLLMIAAVVQAILQYFLCSGILGWFNECEKDPIPNKDVKELAKKMYNQRKNANVTVQGGLFRLADESLIADENASVEGQDAYFTKEPYNTGIVKLSLHLKGVIGTKADTFISVGEKHGINPAFLAAVSALESGWGSSDLAKNHNNIGGIGCAKANSWVEDCYKSNSGREWSTYKSIDDSIEHMGQIIKNKCVDAGKTTVFECWDVYSPPSDGNLNWGPDVVSIMKKFIGDDKNIFFDDEADPDATVEETLFENAIDEAEIWVRTLAQIDLIHMQNSNFTEEDFEEGGELRDSNLHKTYKIAVEKYGNKKDWSLNVFHYMMKVRFDIYTCYFLKDGNVFVDRCKGKEIEKYIKGEDKGVVPQTVKSGDEVKFKYTKRELLDHFEQYSLMNPKSYKEAVELYLNQMHEGMYGPDMAAMTIPSAGWIVPMEDKTYNFSSGFRPPDRPKHNGVDMGTRSVQRVPVYASASGVVISAGRNYASKGRYGGIVTIDHGNGYYSQYSHFWVDDIVVHKGQAVQQGQLLGGAGNDTDSYKGRAPAWHLHFEVCKATRTISGTNMAPGKGPLIGCSDYVDPTSDEIGLVLNKNQDSNLTVDRANKFDKEWKQKAKNGEVIIMPGFVPSLGLGELSAKYENRGDAGTCSSGIGDPGGVSCGKYQIATNTGTLAAFVSWLGSKYPQYHQELSKHKAGSSSFVSAWKQVYNKDPLGFTSAQHNYIVESHYLPQVTGIKSRIGLDVTQRHHAVQEMTWSMAVQHRNNTPGAFESALGKEGWKKMSDAEIITKVYDYRHDRWTCCQPRFKAEKKDALALLAKGGGN